MNGHNLQLAAVKIWRFEQHSVRYKSILFGTKVLTNSYGLSCQNHWVVKRKKWYWKHTDAQGYTLCSVVASQSNYWLPTQITFDNKKYPERTLRFKDALTTLSKREQCRQKHHIGNHVKFCCTKQNAISMHEKALQNDLSLHCSTRQCETVQHTYDVCSRLFTWKSTEYVLVCRNKICCVHSSTNARLKWIIKTSNNCILYLESVISQHIGTAVWHTIQYLITRSKYLERWKSVKSWNDYHKITAEKW